MNEQYKVSLVHSGRPRSTEESLRDQIELLKCEVENLLRENESLIRALAAAGVEWNGVPDVNE